MNPSIAHHAIESLRATLSIVDSCLAPADADAVYTALVAHIRARRPESVSPLGTLPGPTETIRDPRAKG